MLDDLLLLDGNGDDEFEGDDFREWSKEKWQKKREVYTKYDRL